MTRAVEPSAVFDCGDGAHQVVTLQSTGAARMSHRPRPCERCPWRSDIPTGIFPVSAFRHSAATAYDIATTTFACHMSGREKPATCAGFLMRGAEHNLAVRMALGAGRLDPLDVSDGGFPLYASYRAMAVANGVKATDRALTPCRGIDENWRVRRRRKRTAAG